MKNHGSAFWLHAAILITFIGASSAPSPLYEYYAREWGLGSLAVTMVFAVYAVAVLLTLLVVGSLADHFGTRPVLLAAILLQVAAMMVFAFAPGAAVLAGARALQGVATGAAMGAAGSALLAFEGPRTGRGSLVNSAASPVGLSTGALGSAALVGYLPEPTKGVYFCIAVLLLVFGTGLFFIPSAGAKTPGWLHSLLPKASIPAAARRTMVVTMPVAAATWALAGFYLSLGPGLAHSITGNGSVLVGGLALFTLFVPGAAAILVVRRWSDRNTLMAGVVCLMAGITITVLAVQLASAPLYFVGTGVAGLGFGSGYYGAMRMTLPLCRPNERGAMLSSIYVICYLGFSVPAVAAGLLLNVAGMQGTTLVYGSALVLASVPALFSVCRRGRSPLTAVQA
ncbi:MFS transporter [Paenarthrobacter sp. DKR-5]|uniref:MFS transporter n=1 Tax=Paenarthrobacter sp. DKR-5 TaxID=2835535 RepID=UPI001BDD5E48|nr:MFS transporter [Paenarthrobacter sp. DKR-5]MBT1004242.1 MFS transporter [Paenarthrobacter sp. DKR-5]